MGGGGGDGNVMGSSTPQSRKPARISWVRIVGTGGPNGELVASWLAWVVWLVVVEVGQPVLVGSNVHRCFAYYSKHSSTSGSRSPKMVVLWEVCGRWAAT